MCHNKGTISLNRNLKFPSKLFRATIWHWFCSVYVLLLLSEQNAGRCCIKIFINK